MDSRRPCTLHILFPVDFSSVDIPFSYLCNLLDHSLHVLSGVYALGEKYWLQLTYILG